MELHNDGESILGFGAENFVQIGKLTEREQFCIVEEEQRNGRPTPLPAG